MDQGGTAFVLLCAALGFCALPGLLFFYGAAGGVHRTESARPVVVCLAAGAVLWAVCGHAVVFADDRANSFIGIGGVLGIELSSVGLADLILGSEPEASPGMAVSALHALLALFALGLVALCLAERSRPARSVVLPLVWFILVALPVSGWIFNIRWGAEGVAGGGWLVAGLASAVGVGALDFAGGAAVHIAAGAAAVAVVLVRRRGPRATLPFGEPSALRPLITFVPVGGALLWFGWIGLAAGAERAADEVAALVVVNLLAAPAGSLLTWLVVEQVRDGKPTASGAASGAVAGLVAVSAGCAYLTPAWALGLGLLAGAAGSAAVGALRRAGWGVAGRVAGLHLTGGVLGTVFLGVAGYGTGVVYSGRIDQLLAQLIAVVAVASYSFVVTWLLVLSTERHGVGSPTDTGSAVRRAASSASGRASSWES